MAVNPYTAPTAAVRDQREPHSGELILEGRKVPGANAWLWIRTGFSLFMQQPWMWIGLTLLALLILVALAIIPIVGQIGATFINPLLAGGMMLGCRAIDEGEPLTAGHLFAGFRDHSGSLAMIGLASFLYMLVLVLIGMGGGLGVGLLFGGTGSYSAMGLSFVLFLLVFIAVSVPLYMAIWFAPALVVFHDLSALEAMKASFFGCLKNMWPFLWYGLIGLLLAIVASIPLGLGWLVLGPVLVGSIYAGYRDIYLRA